MNDDLLDLVVIGAGPHALSLLTRLIDDEPDLMAESERTRIAHKAGSRGRNHGVVRKHLKKRFNGGDRLAKTVVVDTHGTWMARWQSDFSALDIRHTRSHADLHPCPHDFQSLRVWAEMHKRSDEFLHMQHVDREDSRARGYGGPFTLPSTSLFNDFCMSLVDRYNLAPSVRRGHVVDIRLVDCGPTSPCTFQVHLEDGSCLAAKRVVCAMGPGPMFAGMRATLPWWAEDLAAELAVAPTSPTTRLQHSSQLTSWLRRPDRDRVLSAQRILVVGGGQTAAHLTLLAHKVAQRVVLVSRRRITVKPYDVDLEHVGDFRGKMLQQFWRLDEQERLRFIAKMRGGGSMNPEARDALKHAEVSEDGGMGQDEECPENGKAKRLTILEEMEVSEATWHAFGEEEGMAKDGVADKLIGEVRVRFEDGSEDAFDQVWLATGGNLDLGLVPIFKSLMKQRPIKTSGGLPSLQADLSWDRLCPLHVMGAFAMLQLGPDALNLAGARSGGVLVARALLGLDEEDLAATLGHETRGS